MYDEEYAKTLESLDSMAASGAIRSLRMTAGNYAKALAEQREVMLGVVENGAWVLIPDPALRTFVGRYVADAVAALAVEVGAERAQIAAEQVRGGGRLPLTLDEKPQS